MYIKVQVKAVSGGSGGREKDGGLSFALIVVACTCAGVTTPF